MIPGENKKISSENNRREKFKFNHEKFPENKKI